MLVFASTNSGKLVEAKKIASEFGIEIKGLADFNLANFEVEEDGNSYQENAEKKAIEYYNKLKIPVIADDAGLEVVKLNFKPGIHSARYAGEVPFSRKIELLLQELKDFDDRSAKLICGVCYFDGLNKFYIQEELAGEILFACNESDGGFGYDPIFKPQEYNQSLAGLKKASIAVETARIKALRKLVKELRNRKLS